MNQQDAASGFAALGNETRLELYRTLVRAGEDGVNVGELKRVLDVPASTLAHHLAALVQAGLVMQERRGRETVSRADYERMRALAAYLVDACCTGLRITAGADAA